MSLAREASIFTPDPIGGRFNYYQVYQEFEQLLAQIQQVKYYRPKTKRPDALRVAKKTPDKWGHYRYRKKLKNYQQKKCENHAA